MANPFVLLSVLLLAVAGSSNGQGCEIEPVNGVVTVPDIETLQAQLQCMGHNLLALVAGDIYNSTSAFVTDVLCPISPSLCNAGVSFAFESPAPFMGVGMCEPTENPDYGNNNLPSNNGFQSQACSLMQCAMQAGIASNTDVFGTTMQDIFKATSDSQMTTALRGALGLGYQCSLLAPTINDDFPINNGFSIGGNSDHGFGGYCLNGNQVTHLFGAGGGGGAGLVAGPGVSGASIGGGNFISAGGHGGLSAWSGHSSDVGSSTVSGETDVLGNLYTSSSNDNIAFIQGLSDISACVSSGGQVYMTGGGGGGGGFASDDDLLGSYGVGYGYYFTVNTDIDVPAVYSNSNGGVLYVIQVANPGGADFGAIDNKPPSALKPATRPISSNKVARKLKMQKSSRPALRKPETARRSLSALEHEVFSQKKRSLLQSPPEVFSTCPTSFTGDITLEYMAPPAPPASSPYMSATALPVLASIVTPSSSSPVMFQIFTSPRYWAGASVNITTLSALDVKTGTIIASLALPAPLVNASAGDNVAVWPLPNGIDSAVFLTSITADLQAQLSAYVLNYAGGTISLLWTTTLSTLNATSVTAPILVDNGATVVVGVRLGNGPYSSVGLGSLIVAYPTTLSFLTSGAAVVAATGPFPAPLPSAIFDNTTLAAKGISYVDASVDPIALSDGVGSVVVFFAQYNRTGFPAGGGLLYINLTILATTFYGYNDAAFNYFNNTAAFGVSYQLQALAPMPGCTIQRVMVMNTTAYGMTSQVSVFKPASSSGLPNSCTGNGATPTILTTAAAPTETPAITGNNILVLAKGFSYASPPSVLMFDATSLTMYNNATVLQAAVGSGVTPQKLNAYGTSVSIIPLSQVQDGVSCTDFLLLSTTTTGGAAGLGGSQIGQYTMINTAGDYDYPMAPLQPVWAKVLTNFSSYSAATGASYSFAAFTESNPQVVVQFQQSLNLASCVKASCPANSTVISFQLV